jgi:hypothetical protein
MEENKHIWQFARVGGMNRVCLERGEDLLYLDTLDQKLWTALSCPVNGLEIDSKTLEMIDTDNDGKIRVPEVLAAVKWITSVVKDANTLIGSSTTMPLSEINTDTPLGKVLYASARQLLVNIGKPDADVINVEDISDTIIIFENTKFNGDGVIHAGSADHEELKLLIAQIIECEGAVVDRSGNDGIDAEKIEAFYSQCEALLNWKRKAEDKSRAILSFGDRTEDTYGSFQKLKSKIDDYFLRCQLAEFDAASAETLNSIVDRIETITTKDLTDCIDEISGFPLAKIEPGKPLSLVSGINPAWKDKVNQFKELISSNDEILQLEENDWKNLCRKFVAFETWKGEKVGVEVENLGFDRIQTIVDENRKVDLLGLIEEDKRLEEEANNLILVQKMVRYHRDLFTLLNNFVTFSDFYRLDSNAIFQAGSLYFDQRRCDLCIKVSDLAKHGTMAASSGICLVYFDCFSKTKNEKITIVAAFTDGDVDNLVVGRNAIFYDNAGNDWDATIIKIIDNPISIRQAFWSPYRKVSQLVSKQIEKIASSKEQDVHQIAHTGVEKTSTQVQTASPTANATQPAPFDIAKFAGIFAAIGMAFGAIGGVLATVAKGFFSLTWWKMPIALVGVMLCISGPAMVLAWLKLRKRNLAPVLDANGWAVNAKATINIAFGSTLTHLAKLPKNSKQNLIDPYRKKSNSWIPTLIILLVVTAILFALWYFKVLERWNVI